MSIINLSLIIPKSILTIVTLFLAAKLIGKKQISELSIFDYVIGISMGNFSADMIISKDLMVYLYSIIAIFTFGFSAYMVNYLTRKNIHLRRFLSGIPTIVIEKGDLIYENIKKLNLDINDLLVYCRMNGFFDISQIYYAIMEENGQMSILPKSLYNPVIREDLKINKANEELCCNAIIDGKIMEKNIINASYSINWLKRNLKEQGYQNTDNILLGIISNKKLIIYEKNKKRPKDILE